jgi:hypothetical protein
MSTIMRTSYAFAPLRLFFSPLWRGIFYGAGSSLLCGCFFSLVECTVEVARGTGRRRKKRMETEGFHVGGALLEPWLLQPLWFLRWRDWSLQIYFPASRGHYCLADYGYRLSLVPFLTLTATIMEVKVWTGFFWYRFGSGASMCASSSLAQY